MKTATCASLLALSGVLAAPAALADDDRRRGHHLAVDYHEALWIAESFGMYRVKEVELDDGAWEIEGCTHDGREIEIEISARNGAVIDLEYDDDDDCW